MIVDRVYLNDLKKDCKMAQNNIEKISKSAYKMKIGKKRSDLLKKAKNIDTKSCDILVNYGLEFGAYIKVL